MTRKKVRADPPLCGGHTGVPGAVPPGVVATSPALSHSSKQEQGAHQLRYALRAWLNWHGLSQADAAHALKVSQSAMSLLITRKNTGRRDGLLGRFLTLLVGPGAALCMQCHRILPDEQLAIRLNGLLEEAKGYAELTPSGDA